MTSAEKSSSRLFHKPGYNFNNRNTALARFSDKRIPRYLIKDIIRSGLKNNHGCGLYDYIWCLCHAQTYYEAGGKIVPMHAYITVSMSELIDAFCASGVKSCLSHLQQLKQLHLIDYQLDAMPKRVTISLINRETDSANSREMKMERSAIKCSKGYVIVDKNEIAEAFSPADHYSECDILMYLWLNAIYNDPTYKVSKKSAVVVLPQWGSYFTVQLSSRRLSGVWHCSKSRVNTVLHRLQDDGFITLCHKYGKCLVIGLNHYAEWVLGKAQSTLTDDNVEVDVLGRDPDPIVRSLNKDINRLAAIMKNDVEKKNCLRVNYLSELFRDACERFLEREYLVYGATRFWYVAMRLRRKMLISVNYCPQNRILLFLQSQAIFQLWRRLTRGSASTGSHSFNYIYSNI